MLEEDSGMDQSKNLAPVVELSNGHLINGQEVPSILPFVRFCRMHSYTRSLNPKADTEEVRQDFLPTKSL